MAKESANVALKEEKTQLVTPASDEMFDDARRGLEGVGVEDLAIPFLVIIQSGSPQRKKTDGAYIPGAEEGMIFNSVNNALFEETVLVPCAFERKMIHWRPREEGGGFMGTYAPSDPICAQAERQGARDVMPDGTYLVNTAQHYCLHVMPDGTFKRVVVSMSSTQLKKSRKWLTIVGEKTLKNSAGVFFTPPSFAFKYNLKTQPEENDKGSWYGWRVEEAGMLDLSSERELYLAARAFSEAVSKGAVQVATPPSEEEEIPF